jgi:RHS repeat-associated protein
VWPESWYPAYDALTIGKERLTSVSNSVSATSYSGYDAMVRPTGSTQATDGVAYSRYDYHPFGEQTATTFGNRASIAGYSQPSDFENQKFTSKERDNETGLDYFGARYYGSTQGRFTSADPLMTSGTIYSPQSWNRYTYTSNNPLRFVDPTGMWDWDASAGGSDTDAQLEAKQDNKSLKKKERNAAKDALKYRQRFRDALAGATALAQSGRLNATQQAEVAQAVRSYGTEGDGNKVLVAFGPQASGTGATTDGAAADDSIVVTFGRGAKGFDLIADVAHEGSHVLDNQSFNLLHSNGGMYFDGRNGDISQYETERRAYEVTSLVAQAKGRGSYLNDSPSYEVWSSGWKAAERETKRARAIDRVISSHYGGISPTNPGWTFDQIKHVP